MPPPVSVFNQPVARVTAVPAWSLVPSPRNYNASIIEHDGRRLMAYRSHRLDQQGRCGIVICQLDAKWHAKPKSNTWLNLPEQVQSVTVHQEDPRLFTFRGRLHVSYTETQFHGDRRPYTCVMKYARLKETKAGWAIDRAYWPKYGRNDGSHQEKNWQFFDTGGVLSVIYEADPHTIIELASDGETVSRVSIGERGLVRWPWGTIRGGTPPVRVAGGNWLTVFHSATPYPVAPFWRRYYAGAYTFEPEPPYRITAISQRPILTGSEADGHAHDPRNIDSWKPFVVFPSGTIRLKDDRWAVSYGVNDYMTVVVEHDDFNLGDPLFAKWGPRYFRTENANSPIRMFVQEDKPPVWIKWDPIAGGMAGCVPGVLSVHDPRVALHLLEEVAGAEEISAEQYRSEKNRRR